MIVTQPKTNIVTSGIQGAVSFGIKNEGLAHIFNVLRNQLYSDKILAVLREYSCNAVDAHVEAGCPDKPIKVTLPNRMNLNLQIRDYGLGLSEQDIQDIYAYYGESTKRNSNSLIGQLGLGSKSAFAYGDNFVINSFCDGKKTTYNAYIDATQVGQIAKLASVDSDEPTGVEIVIPVRPSDIDQFITKATHIYKHFAVRPEIVGQPIKFEEQAPLMSGDTWKLFSYDRFGSNTGVAVMGNIGYAINSGSLKLEDSEESYRNILASNLIANFKIGDLDIAASREGLQYTDKTINAIKSKLKSVQTEMVKQATDSLNNSPSLFSFKKMLCKFDDIANPYYIVSKCVKSFSWKGQKVDQYLSIRPQDDANVIRYTPRKGYVGSLGYMVKGGDLTSNLGGNKIHLAHDMVAIENTKKVTGNLVNYAFNFLKDGKQVLIFTPKDAAHRSSMMNAYGLCDSDLVDIKTLQKITLPRATRSSGKTATAVQSKHLKKMFVLDHLKNYTSVQSDHWKEIDIDVDDASVQKDYVWVEINKFTGTINGRENISANQIQRAINSLAAVYKHAKNVKTFDAPKVIGVKKDKVSDMSNSPIKHISKYAEELLAKLEKDTNFSNQIRELETYTEFVSDNRVMSSVLDKAKSPNAKKLFGMLNGLAHCPTTELLRNNFVDVHTTLFFGRADILPNPSKALEVIKSKIKAFGDKYALLRYVDNYSLSNYRDEHKIARSVCIELIEERDAELAHLV